MIEPIDWEARLTDAVKKTVDAMQARRDERAAFKARRDAGLVERYRAKEARSRARGRRGTNRGRGATMADHHIDIDAGPLDGPQRRELHMILKRAAHAPSISAPVADLLTRAAAAAYLTIPEELTRAEVRRRMDEALTPDGRVRDTWKG